MRIAIPASLLVLTTFLPSQQVEPSSPPWQRARAVWFGNGETPSIAAEVGFGFEALPFDDDQKRAFDGLKVGGHLALGKTMWSTFETFTDVECGKEKVKSGQYYAAVTKSADGFALALFDAAKVRSGQLLPGTSTGTTAIATLPLRAADGTGSALAAEWELQDGGASLHLHVGPHTLTAELRVNGSAGAFPLAQPEPRRCSRIAFGAAKGDAQPFAALDHGAPPWNAEHAAAASALPVGKRWRLGQDWPTTLETNVPLTLAGKKLAAGSWHLTLAKQKGEAWSLVVSEARADYAAKVDGFAPDAVHPVLEVPLKPGKAAVASPTLAVEFTAASKGTELAITFGEQRLTVPIAAAVKARG